MSYRIADLRCAEELEVTDDVIRVWLRGGRTLTVPLRWFPRLSAGTPDERNRWELIESGTSVRWPELDVELAVDDWLADSPPEAGTDWACVGNLKISGHTISVWLQDGRTLTVPLHWFPRLCGGTVEERNNWIAPGWSMISWPDLDEDLTVRGLLAGGWSAERARTLGRWLLARQEGRGIEHWQIVEHHRSDPKPVPLA